MKVTLIYKPEERERMLFKRCIWVTMGKTEAPAEPPRSQFIRSVKTLADQSGYDLLDRIKIRDRRTGRCYR